MARESPRRAGPPEVAREPAALRPSAPPASPTTLRARARAATSRPVPSLFGGAEGRLDPGGERVREERVVVRREAEVRGARGRSRGRPRRPGRPGRARRGPAQRLADDGVGATVVPKRSEATRPPRRSARPRCRRPRGSPTSRHTGAASRSSGRERDGRAARRRRPGARGRCAARRARGTGGPARPR